ncbi:MAG: SDR family NAD(P)-dependent oxidoreductase [Cyclobacteriaceae bacterium]
MKKKANILITGGAGYLGAYLTEQLLGSGVLADRLVIYSRDELKHFDLKIRIKEDPRVKFMIGDVRDQERLSEAMSGIDVVIHAAAMKHVGICEENPSECVKTNINGTENVIRAARSQGVSKLVFVSTDKAVEPASVYGDSKHVGERLCLKANGDEMQTVVLRLGNLIGSSGSIVDKLRKYPENGVFKLSDSGATRFFDSLPNAWSLVEEAINKDFGGCVMISRLRALGIKELVHAIAPALMIVEEGLGQTEKRHEQLVAKSEMERLLENDRYYLLPYEKLNVDEALERFRSLPADLVSYSSSDVALMKPEEIQLLFADFGLLKKL